MADLPIELMRLSNGTCSDDGTRVRFRIESPGDGGVEIECAHSDIESVIRFMIGLGGLAAARRPEVTPHTMGRTDRVRIDPIDISDLGFMRERESGETVLVMRMFGFDLGFAVSRDQLAGLKAELDRLVPDAPDGHDHHHDHHH